MERVGSLLTGENRARRAGWGLSTCAGDVARVVELADTPDLGSGVERRAGSSPVPGTN